MEDAKGEDISGDGGVAKVILVEGSGPTVPISAHVKVHYIGKLLDGTVFDSSVNGDPFEFILCEGEVVKGWYEGIRTMKKGEKAILTCSPEYAYGSAGCPPKIPPNATLKFEVEVMDWVPDDLSSKCDNGISRYTIEPGTGMNSIDSEAEVDVTIVGECEGSEFMNERLQFCLDEAYAKNLPHGVEKALKKMSKGEKSKIILQPKDGFGDNGNKELKIPPNAILCYTITVHGFENAKKVWLMNHAEMLEHSRELKERGTAHYKKNNFTQALKVWSKLCTVLDTHEFDEKDQEEERKTLLIAGFLNCAMALLKTNNFNGAVKACNQALALDKDNVKALFRRGQGLLSLNNPQLAKADFLRITVLEPTNKAAANQVIVCQTKAIKLKEAEKKIYANMFDKLSKDEDWRYGWWDGNVVVDIAEDDNDIEEEMKMERKKQLEGKRKFLEMKAREKLEFEQKKLESDGVEKPSEENCNQTDKNAVCQNTSQEN